MYSRSVAGATVYHYSFLLATPYKPKEEWAMFSVGNSRIFLYSKRTGTVYKFVESGDEWGFKPGTIR